MISTVSNSWSKVKELVAAQLRQSEAFDEFYQKMVTKIDQYLELQS
jgi:hypothetical protein